MSRKPWRCSETMLTGESRFHISTPLGIEPGPLMTGSKGLTHWNSETVYECGEISGSPQGSALAADYVDCEAGRRTCSEIVYECSEIAGSPHSSLFWRCTGAACSRKIRVMTVFPHKLKHRAGQYLPALYIYMSGMQEKGGDNLCSTPGAPVDITFLPVHFSGRQEKGLGYILPI
jgi:hypothetical protein